MKKKYCCGANSEYYHRYYSHQAGTGMNFFRGYASQSGHGIGSMISSLFRRALPFLKRGLKFFGKHAIGTAQNVFTDVSDNNLPFMEALKARVPQGIKSLAAEKDLFKPIDPPEETVAKPESEEKQKGEGYRSRRKRTKRKKTTAKTKKQRKRPKFDIFD